MLVLALALLAATPAFAKGAKPEATPTVAAPAPAGAGAASFVLLNRATWLRLAPSDEARKFRDPRVGQPRISKAPLMEEDFWVLRFVEKDAKGWVTVETVPRLVSYPNREQLANGVHCYPGAEVSELALRFYVRAEELQTVLTKTVTHEAKDGTGFTLRPGVAVGRPTAERIPVSIDGLRFDAAIPADAVGTTYQPTHEPFGLDANTALARIVPAATVTLDGATVDTTRATVSRPSSTTPLAGGGSLVATEWNCGRYRLKVVPPNGKAALEERAGLMGGLGLRGSSDLPTVNAGTKAWWRDGSPAGHAVGKTTLEPERAKAGTRRCFGFSLERELFGIRVAAKDPIEVCFDAKDVTAPAR